MNEDFREIRHAGGKINFRIDIDECDHQAFQVKYSSSGPIQRILVALYALPQGIPVAKIHLGGIGDPWDPPPVPECFPVLITSDSESHFGHKCPHCEQYWRSGPWPNFCPYCRALDEPYRFLSEAQMRYVHHYCHVLSEALASTDAGNFEIDMDEIADAASTDGGQPPFYASEESQQRKFRCSACNEFNDILGRFGYCSLCGTRNDLSEFETQTVPEIRQRLKNGIRPEDCVRDAVAAFESLVGRITRELARLVPMTPTRKQRLLKQRFHNLTNVREILSEWFDINLETGITPNDWDRTVLMFHRRHVYEHNGGEVDQKYLDDSGDSTVRLKQRIHETQQNAHLLLGSLLKMARNLLDTFHKIFCPVPEPIAVFQEQQSRRPKRARSAER